jgi:hypothetical protein
MMKNATIAAAKKQTEHNVTTTAHLHANCDEYLKRKKQHITAALCKEGHNKLCVF